MRCCLTALVLPALASVGLGLALAGGPASAADLDDGYAPPPVERVYERPLVVEERPIMVERPIIVARPYYRPFYRPYGYYRPYRPAYGPRFAYGPRPWGWYR